MNPQETFLSYQTSVLEELDMRIQDFEIIHSCQILPVDINYLRKYKCLNF